MNKKSENLIKLKGFVRKLKFDLQASQNIFSQKQSTLVSATNKEKQNKTFSTLGNYNVNDYTKTYTKAFKTPSRA